LKEQELNTLVSRRLLRIEPYKRTERVELTHDLLTGVVRAHRDRRRKHTQLAILSAAALGVVLLAFVGFALYTSAVIASAMQERNRALAQVENRRHEIELLIDEKQRELAALEKRASAKGQAAGDLRAVISSAQRSLAATRTGIETDRLAVLVRQLNDPAVDVRKAAGERLSREFRANPLAIGMVLDSLQPGKIDDLSAEGRINVLYFLNRSDLNAWTPEQKRTARDTVTRIRARGASGIAIGAQTRRELDMLADRSGR
jgi:hypothetical protein